MSWLYVPGLADLNSDSAPPCPEPPPSVTWRGKPTPPRSWRAAWKKATWLQRLSGLTSPPSMAARGVASWIASLRASRVSLTPAQESDEATPTSEHSGPSSCASLTRSSQPSSSSRTFPSSFPSSLLFTDDCELWASTALRRCYIPPTRSAESTDDGVCLSSLPTPLASDHKVKRHARWNPQLSLAIDRLPTPTTRDSKGAFGIHTKGGSDLPYAIRALPTPMVQDAASSGAAGYSTQIGRHSGTTLTDAIVGAGSRRPSGTKVNPRLREWIMGLPPGWTRPDPLAPQSIRSWRQSLSACLRRILDSA